MGGTVSASKAPPPSLFTADPSICKTSPDWKTGNLAADPNYGFEGKQRKERVMVATHAEMVSAKVPLEERDYCAHHWIDFMKCKKDKFPLVYRCHPERHSLEHCQYEDYMIRMKEFERERRLLHRKQRKEKKAHEQSAGADE